MSERLPSFAALLSTGPSPAEDAVVEVAAVRPDLQGEAAAFLATARVPGLSRAQASALGLPHPLQPDGAPADVLRGLLAFCDGAPLVVADAAAFTAFLEAQGVRPPEPLLDVIQLVRIAVPTAADYSPDTLATLLGLPTPPGRRAHARALLVADLWEALLDHMAALPAEAQDLVALLLQTAANPLAPLLASARESAGEFELSADAARGPERLFRNHRELLSRAQKQGEEEAGEEPIPTEGICGMFRPGGPVGRLLPGYEQRDEQVEMVRAVCDALNGASHLVVEAGTGTGKSLAYLLPVIAYTCTNRDKVVVSTNTRNLQEQLYSKDLPILQKLLPGRFEAALLKGRTNYLCVRRFLHVARYFARELAEPEEFTALAALAAWAARTETGDLAECNGFLLSPACVAVSQTVVTRGDECAGRACPFRGRCFVNRARALAQLADLIVVNHALLFAEIGLDSPVLPPYRCVVFDEAHNLEDVATDALSVVVDGIGVYRVTNRLYRRGRDGSGTGLLATAMYEAGRLRERSGGASPTALREACSAAMGAVDDVVNAARQFFELIAAPFQEVPPQVERLMLRECYPDLGPGSEAWQAVERMRESVGSLGEKVEELATVLEAAADDLDTAEELAGDLRAQVAQLRELCEAAEFALSQEDEARVYWLERVRRDRRVYCSLHAAPLRIGDYLRAHFLDEKRCVILTSATLQVDGTFDYVIERIGAEGLPGERLQCLALGSPFDYDRQALVGVTTFLPDPGGRRDKVFDAELGAFLADLFQCTGGRAMVLFTSYSLLNAVYEAVKPALQRTGITVLAQGHSGSRQAITHLFRTRDPCVLLGTRSFWEGVDISGDALSCLVLTKLPFHVFTDPLVRGRVEYLQALGRDPFVHYTLPEAVIGFRQGFGRLIRTRTDRGVVIVTDRRVVGKAYGRSFLASLPTRHRVFRTSEEALAAVSKFFNDATKGRS